MGKARTICTYRDSNGKVCNEEVEVGNRSIHLVEVHEELPPEKWLKRQSLPKDGKIIAKALREDRKRKPYKLIPPWSWISKFFDFDPQ